MILSSPMVFGFFFHEYGRRVGMVPRSSLKGGKNSLMAEKRTRKPNTTQNKQTPQPRAHRPCLHHHVVFPLCKVKLVRRKRVSRRGPELTNEKHVGAGLRSSKVAKRLQRDFTSPLWVTSGHTPVRQNHGHDAILHSNTGYRNA